MGLILIWILSTGAARGESLGEAPVSGYIRLHVVAADDGAAAQALKLEVRDAVLAAVRPLVADCGDAGEAWRRIGQSVEALEAAATGRARALGYDGPVAAETGVFDFPDRHYGAVFVPAGEYRALRVVLGAGEGRNWWCVLYPSLCLPEDVDPDAPVQFHSVILDWLRGLFGGDDA